MLLQPRKFKYKTFFKGRRFKKFSINNFLKYGHSGLMLLKSTRLRAKQISKFKIFLKRATKKVDKTQRFAWINIFPHLPLTRKPEQSRMGKGKGKIKTWFVCISSGVILLEFRNLRYGRSLFFFKSFSTKLQVNTQVIVNNNIVVKSSLLLKQQINLKMFW